MNKEEIITLSGEIENIIYRNDENGYVVFELSAQISDIPDGELITAVGSIPFIEVGEEISLTGAYTFHQSFGRQFKVSAYERKMPSTTKAIIKYLSCGAVKGIGPVIAKRLVAKFGTKSLEIMEKEPDRLTEVQGISPKKSKEISDDIKRLFGIKTVMAFLAQYNIEPLIGVKIWNKWKILCIDIIKANPFVLCGIDIGIDFEQADIIRSDLGFDTDVPCRIRAGLFYVLQHNLFNGHTCLPKDKLCGAAVTLVDCELYVVEDCLAEQLEEKSLFSCDFDGEEFIYLPELYNAEMNIVTRLNFMSKYPLVIPKNLDFKISECEKAANIVYEDLQVEGIRKALSDGLLILTGGPGTGKTTILKAVIELLIKEGKKVELAAPTGRAAKRMSEVTGRNAKTIHRLLEVGHGEGYFLPAFQRNENSPLNCDYVIVDEMSMVDSLLFDALLKAMPHSSHLIMVGDADQLPAVGPGNLLRDLIESEVLPVVELKEIYRQAGESLIITNAHAIVRGELPEIDIRDQDFFVLKSENYEFTAKTVVDLCKTRLPKSYGYSVFSDIQVLVPGRMGAIGMLELNRVLQQALNPPSKDKNEIKYGIMTYRTGDKIMQVKNNYDIVWKKDDGERGTGIYNGDIGIIEEIDKKSSFLKLRFEDRIVEYPFDFLMQLELSYAATIHKSQGSEFEAVIIPLMKSHKKLHFRNLLYTAVTRAKKILIIVGSPTTINEMVENNRKTYRYTGIKYLLENSYRN